MAPIGRRYWVVSPNVTPGKAAMSDWKDAIEENRAVFMGWRLDHPIGRRFVESIQHGDIVLIARSHQGHPEVIGCGMVSSDARNSKRGLVLLPKGSQWKGTWRRLDPFIPLSGMPTKPNFHKIVQHTMALCEISPKLDGDKEQVCRWLDKQCESGKIVSTPLAALPAIRSLSLTDAVKRGYTYMTAKQIRNALRREDQLVNAYKAWIERRGDSLDRLKCGSLTCDVFEKKRNNLIEAKCFVSREHIRMAVGQLLDYSNLFRSRVQEPNLAILLPDRPQRDIEDWLKNELKISVIWRKNGEFEDNAGKQFI